MSTFTVRIELHDNVYADFEVLHSAMQREGFTHLITADNGVTYYLPRAEYNITTFKSRAEVLNAAARAAQVTGKSHEILVTESNGRNWRGLREKR